LKRRRGAATIAVLGLLLLTALGGYVYNSLQGSEAGIQQPLSPKARQLTEQEKLEAKRRADKERQLAAEREEQRQKRVLTLKRQYEEAVISLRAENEKLEQVKEFHFLRTVDEKEEQVRDELEAVRNWENKVFRLQNEMSLLGATVNR
jgi:hypothetical protein